MSPYEEEAVCIIDNRDLSKANNKLLLICEHASNDLKGTYLEHNERKFSLGHDAYDPGASDLSHYISEHTKCMAVHANFSRMLIDPA
jgi:predicted N-formylglutamate amidohydrolase